MLKIEISLADAKALLKLLESSPGAFPDVMDELIGEIDQAIADEKGTRKFEEQYQEGTLRKRRS